MTPMDLEALVATMPFAVTAGIVLDAAAKDEVRGAICRGRRSAARRPG